MFEVESIDKFQWIINYKDFKKKYTTNKWKINKKYVPINRFLNKLKNKLNSDPIDYLAYLYYNEEMYLLDIEEHISKLGVQFPYPKNQHLRKRISNLFTNKFWWKLRSSKESAELKKENSKTKILQSTQNTSYCNYEDVTLVDPIDVSELIEEISLRHNIVVNNV